VLAYRPSAVTTARPAALAPKAGLWRDLDGVRFDAAPSDGSIDNSAEGAAEPLSAAGIAAKLAQLRASLNSDAPLSIGATPSASAEADLRPLLMAQSMAAFGVRSGEGEWKAGQSRDVTRFDYFAA